MTMRGGRYPMGEDSMAALIEQLEALADEKYRVFNEKLTPGTAGNLLGVRMPALRRIAGQILHSDPAGFLDASLYSALHELRMLHVIVLAREATDAVGRLSRIRACVPTLENWAVCDTLCNDLKPDEELKALLLPDLRVWAQSAREFEARFAYVMLMLYYRDAAHIDETLRLYAAFHHEGYYARMGAAWGLSFLYIDWPGRTLDILKGGSLDRFTHNKAIQKIIESYRVSDADKALLRTLRR